MEVDDAVSGLAALAHPGRLQIFRLLVQAGEAGLAPGEIARVTGSLSNTLSTNLRVLASADLVSSRREGRVVLYRADYERMRDLLAYLMEDCCGGSPEICAPLMELTQRAACCVPEPATN